MASTSSSGTFSSIVVRSSDPAVTTPSIDWNGTSTTGFASQPVPSDCWVADFLGIPESSLGSLGDLTGLVVRAPQ